MVKVTYNPRHPSDPAETEWDGRKFNAGKSVEYDGRAKEHKSFIERAKLNPWFDVDGETAVQRQVSDAPTTSEEYRAYAIDWFGKVKSSRDMERRWSDERDMRDNLGWGSDDQALIEPIYAPRLENLRQSESI
jgi:hypothetical protein